MSVSKSSSSVLKDCGKLPLKERGFQDAYSKQKRVVVQKSVASVKKPHVPVEPDSLREEFIKALKVSDKSGRTVSSYCDAVKMFQTFINRSPLNVTVNDIRAFFFI